MRRTSKREKDYLEALEKAERKTPTHMTPLISEEYSRRFEKKEPKTTPDTARYAVDPPSVKYKTNAKKWEESIENAKAQLEHNCLRVQNLELMKKYSQNAWKKHCEELEVLVKRHEVIVRDTKEETERLNASRRRKQMEAGRHIDELMAEWKKLTRKCGLIELELEKMERLDEA